MTGATLSLRNAHLHRRQRTVQVVLFGGAAAAAITALVVGAVKIDLLMLLEESREAEFQRAVFAEIRGPRILLAMSVGASLGVAGAVLQGLFRNPLADPGLIGVSSGAAVGALGFIVFGGWLTVPDTLVPYGMPLAAVLGATLVTTFLYLFSRRYGHFNILTMLLAGIAINAIAGVCIGAFQYLSDDVQLRALVFWMMGSFGRASWTTLLPALALMVLSIVPLLRHSRELDRLQLGEAQALHIGVNVPRLKRNVILLSAALVGAGVALTGIVGFVGLVVPHLVRMLGGVAHQYVVPSAGLLGAILTVMADLLARTLVVPAELPVGLVTSALGGPFFLWLMTRARARAI